MGSLWGASGGAIAQPTLHQASRHFSFQETTSNWTRDDADDRSTNLSRYAEPFQPKPTPHRESNQESKRAIDTVRWSHPIGKWTPVTAATNAMAATGGALVLSPDPRSAMPSMRRALAMRALNVPTWDSGSSTASSAAGSPTHSARNSAPDTRVTLMPVPNHRLVVRPDSSCSPLPPLFNAAVIVGVDVQQRCKYEWACDEFRRGTCARIHGTACPQQQRHYDSIGVAEAKDDTKAYGTSACREWVQEGTCAFGVQCTYRHFLDWRDVLQSLSPAQLRQLKFPHPKSRLCARRRPRRPSHPPVFSPHLQAVALTGPTCPPRFPATLQPPPPTPSRS